MTHVEALGTALERTTTFTRASGSNLLTTVEDGLSRETDYTYDTDGNVTSIVRLAGTADETTTAFTYEPAFNQVASVTDPLSQTTTFTYDTAGHLTAVTDPLSHQATFTYKPGGASGNGHGCPESDDHVRLRARRPGHDHKPAVADHHALL